MKRAAPFFLFLLAAVPNSVWISRAHAGAPVDWRKKPVSSVPADGGGLELDDMARDWLAALPSEEDRKRAAKALSLGGQPYAWLNKDGGVFRVEACGLFEGPMAKAVPVFRDAAAYADWAFEKINERLGKGARYLVEFEPLTLLSGRSTFLVRYKLTNFFKGPRSLRLDYAFREGAGGDAGPAMAVSLPEPTKMVRRLKGELRLYRLPGDRSFLLFFDGEAEAHWVFYYLVPATVVEEDAEERVLRVMDNAGKRAGTPLRKT